MTSVGHPSAGDREGLSAEIERLRDELALTRLELSKARQAEEEALEKLGKQRRSRVRAERQAEALAKAMSDLMMRRFRVDMRRGRWHRALTRDLPTAREWSQVQLLRQSQYFWPGWYLRHNLDVAEAGVEPALHFLRSGFKEGRDPSPNFSVKRYVDRHPEVRRRGLNPLVYAIETGTAPPPKHKRGKQDT